MKSDRVFWLVTILYLVPEKSRMSVLVCYCAVLCPRGIKTDDAVCCYSAVFCLRGIKASRICMAFYCAISWPRGIKAGRVFWLVAVLYHVQEELRFIEYRSLFTDWRFYIIHVNIYFH